MVSPNGTGADNDPLDEEMLQEEMLQFELTDETYEALVELEGSQVVGIAFWDSSLADELEDLEAEVDTGAIFDLDLYLEDNQLLELYAALLYQSADDGPIVGIEAVEQLFARIVEADLVLDEVAQTEDGGLVIVLAVEEELALLITVGAWAIDEWDELPET